jgi:CHAT domain-containing protein/Tfp pilus assembly protein PilF
MSKWKICKSAKGLFLLFVISHSIVLLSSILLFSEPSVAIIEQHQVKTAQLKQTAETRAADETYQKAKQLYEQGTAESLTQAIVLFQQALVVYRKVGDRTSQAFTVAHIGKIYSDLGQQQKALDYLNQALVLRREIGDKKGETITLNNIGHVYGQIGEFPKALEYFQQALSLRRQMGDKKGEAVSINNIGNVYLELGEPQKALDNFEQSLILRRETGDKLGEVRTLNNIGHVYSDLGEQQKALDYYNQCLPLYKEVEDKAAESATINNIGAIYLGFGETQKALSYFEQSLALRKKYGDKLGEARTINNIGRVYLDLGDRQKALSYFQQSLPLFQAVENKLGIAANLKNIGYVYLDLNEKQKALSYFEQSLPIYKKVGNREGEAQTLYSMAIVQRDLGNLQLALEQIKIAINIVEDQRTKINSQELRASYFATVQDYYQFYIDLLMLLHQKQPSQGYDALALQTSERARARSLLELLSEANADIRQGVEPKLISQERSLQQQLDNLEKRRIQILSGEPSDVQVKTLETENEKLLEQYQQIRAKIRATSPRYAALTQPQPLSVAEIQQQVLDEDTILLEYSLGERRSYLWLVTNQNITTYELPKRADIEAAVQNFRQGITTPYIQPTASINALSKLILSPVATQLKNKRLLIVSDGALQYVPFAALTNPNSPEGSNYEPLLVNHEIITLPSASTLAILRREQKQRRTAARTLVVLADPIFSGNDERLQGKSQASAKDDLDSLALTRAARDAEISFDRLNFTREEAKQILTLVPANQAKQAVDFSASRSTATSGELSQYKIVHFATHGIINSKHPELSGIVLSLFDESGNPQNGFLRLHDVFNLKLQAELVVLSACQTGLGGEVRGEGLVGLTRGFMYAGSPRVVVSLWSVDDQATSELMKAFYGKMLKTGLKPAAALRAAQIEIWRNQTFTNPYYWAAFTLQGEWK